MLIKVVTKSITLDIIDWWKKIHTIVNDYSVDIHSQPQNIGTKAQLLLLFYFFSFTTFQR